MTKEYKLTKEIYKKIDGGNEFIDGLITWGEDNDIDDEQLEYIEVIAENREMISLGYDLALENLYSLLAGIEVDDDFAVSSQKLLQFYQDMGD